MAINQAKVVTVTSVKGGVGKTITTLNLAGILLKKEIKTLVIDLDLYGGGIATSLNIDNETDIYKLVDDLTNNRFTFIDNYIVKYNEFIDVLPAPKEPRFATKISAKYINIILTKAKLKYDFILIDTNHFLNDINLTAFDLSDETLYVISNDPIDLKNMRSMVSIMKDMEKTNYKIILNNAKDKLKSNITNFDIKSVIKDNIDYIIPSSFYNKNINKYIVDGKILVLDKNNKKYFKIFESIINNIIKEK